MLVTKSILLDAWAILALIQSEQPAATRIKHLLEQSRLGDDLQIYLSIINLGEVFYIICRSKGESEAEKTIDLLRSSPIRFLPATEERVLAAAQFKARHRLSYADAFAASATTELGATLVTGDPELVLLAGEIPVEQLERVGE
jgi:predicted nucleic acid-binding protein